jgi:hypothetical protein
MRTRQQSSFLTITSEGALLPIDILQKIALFDREIDGLDGETYNLVGIKLNEAISTSWGRLLSVWQGFQSARDRLRADESGLTQTRERWLLPLFQELGYGRLYTVKPLEIEEKSYPISHSWQHIPIHMVSLRSGLEDVTRNAASGYRSSPYSLVQEFLNRSPEHLWGLVSNGLRLRLLRKNASLTRQAYVEFDLEAMFTGESYADFILFWLLCHQSRVESEHPAECWLERWSRLAQEQGVRVLNQLRNGVEEAINLLGGGFLAHPANGELREKLHSGNLKAQDYYNQVLRFVYRLLILFVAEDRDILFDPASELFARQRYAQYYSMGRLRRMAGLRLGTRHSDLFRALWLVMEQLGSEGGYSALGLPALNGFLFSSQRSLPDLIGCELENASLLTAVRALAFTEEKAIRRTVDYKNLGAEELGSVYESLLELHPQLDIESASFKLAEVSGNARKTSGSYYTPTSLIDCLLDSALDPVLAEASTKPDPEAALLALNVCDPACGSGHFLIAAAHRIAKRLAAVRTGTEEPGQKERRAALRDIIGHCIYGVDINPMAVELCKVSLWMEAIEPGKPLSFLDAHIQCGNSLLGTTPSLLRAGIPDEAFNPIEGDDKKICNGFRKKNKELRAGQISWIREDRADQMWEHQGTLMNSSIELESMSENTVRDIHSKEKFFADVVNSGVYQNALLWANTWCAAFVWKKTTEMRPPITHEEFLDIEKNPFTLAPWRKAEIERLAKQYQFFHWHLAFPEVFRVPVGDATPENEQAGWSGGFDVVLGNPPWERIKIQEKEWFATRRPTIAEAPNAAARRKMIAALQTSEQTSDKELYADFLDDQRQATGESHFVRDSARYPLCGRGDVNTYAIFAENMRWIVCATGRVGCIVPSGIATDDTTKWFFGDLVGKGSLASLFSFENEAKLFPEVEHHTRFALVTLVGKARVLKSADFVYGIHHTSSLEDVDRHFSLSADDIALLNPNTSTCPTFRSKRDMELTKAVYQRVPVLINEREGLSDANPWKVSYKRMFDMTNDSGLFRTKEQLTQGGWKLIGNVFHKGEERYLPLYEGKMISIFDHRFGSYEKQTEAQARQGKLPEFTPEQHDNPTLLPIPHYWIHESQMQKITKDRRPAFLAFRDIARATDIRTAVFSIIPIVACGNKLPVILTDPQYFTNIKYLVTNTSSFAFDYITRQKIGGASLNLFILKQLPALPPSAYQQSCLWSPAQTLGDWIAPRALELTYTAWDLETFAQDCDYDGPPFRWDEDRRFFLRCELDAAYFLLYEIARDDVAYIMGTFRVWKEKEEKQIGEYRTKRVILEIYDEMLRACQSGQPADAYCTRLVPGPADPAVAHEPRLLSRLEAD